MVSGALLGLVASAALGWWWLDPEIALAIAALAVRLLICKRLRELVRLRKDMMDTPESVAVKSFGVAAGVVRWRPGRARGEGDVSASSGRTLRHVASSDAALGKSRTARGSFARGRSGAWR